MLAAFPLTFAAPWAGYSALCVAALAAVVTVWRRPAAPGTTLWLCGFGLALLGLAAAGLTWHRPAAVEVAVLVDMSPSTRTAGYRDRDALEQRVRQLLGDTPYRVWYFADDAPPVDSRNAMREPGAMREMAGRRTLFPTTSHPVILAFTDGRFAAAPSPGGAVYPVIDAGLDRVRDGSIERLEVRPQDASIGVRSDEPRVLSLAGVGGEGTTVPVGRVVLTRPVTAGGTAVSAQLAPGDAWPENDALSAPVPPAATPERWIIGTRAAPPGWRSMQPSEQPTDAAAYLRPAVIVLDNVAASDLSAAQQERLRQYVRDLGGGLVIAGGDRAFAAGGYSGSALEALSPLASTPPTPTTHWILLADASGSMNASSGAPGGPRLWDYAGAAIAAVVPTLPPEDVVTVGSFAEQVRWWTRGRPVKDALAERLPPAGIAPSGPTNLRAALEQVIEQTDAAMPKQVLLLTDTDAEMGDVTPLIDAMRRKKIQVHLVALGDGQGLAALRRISGETGGRIVQQREAARWSDAMRELARAAGPSRLEVEPVQMQFGGELAALAARGASPWNRTWLKKDASELARATWNGERIVPAGRWAVGTGRALAVGFSPNGAEMTAMADAVARPPRDPRFRVEWIAGERLTVKVDAVTTEGEYLNERGLSLELSTAGGALAARHAVPQAGPGGYELSIEAPRDGVIATVRVDGDQVLERFAVAGRYAAEFEAVGNDRAALRELARISGGRVVEPAETGPLQLRWPGRDVNLSSWLAMAGAVLVALGLVWWRMT